MNNDMRFEVRLSKQEYQKLKEYAQYCGMNKSEYIRSLLSGCIPKVAPPYNYYLMMKELRSIGGSLNQLAKVANAERYIDAEKYKAIASYLFEKVSEIESAVSAPISIEDYPTGDN